jgi:hypothetical protein
MANPLLREGPVPAFVHGVIEYGAALLFFAAPTILSFEASAATATSIGIGVVVLVVAASSALPTGLIKAIPIPIHVALDYILALFLIAVPFLFNFDNDQNAMIFFMGLGIVHLLMTIGTKFERSPGARGGTRTPTSEDTGS